MLFVTPRILHATLFGNLHFIIFSVTHKICGDKSHYIFGPLHFINKKATFSPLMFSLWKCINKKGQEFCFWTVHIWYLADICRPTFITYRLIFLKAKKEKKIVQWMMFNRTPQQVKTLNTKNVASWSDAKIWKKN